MLASPLLEGKARSVKSRQVVPVTERVEAGSDGTQRAPVAPQLVNDTGTEERHGLVDGLAPGHRAALGDGEELSGLAISSSGPCRERDVRQGEPDGGVRQQEMVGVAWVGGRKRGPQLDSGREATAP